MSQELGKYSTAAEVLAAHGSVAGHHVVITGGLSGLGLETTRAFSDAGARVTVGVRRPDAYAEELAALGDTVSVAALDLSSPDSVRAFAAGIEGPVNVLICNAGVMAIRERILTAAGHEMQFATNHLGHFLLANLLLEQLAAAAPARVVFVSSMAHKRALQASGRLINWGDIHFEQSEYTPFGAYAQSKGANVMCAAEFSRRFGGRGVIAMSLHPGVISTPLQRHLSREEMVAMGWCNADGEFPQSWKTPAQGASTSCFAAVAPGLQGGEYLSDCAVQEPNDSSFEDGGPLAYVGVHGFAFDEAEGARLWEESAAMVGL